jgi:hypothetical protein
MPRLTLVLGLLLVALGVVAYLGTGRESVTALIPAFFGIALAVLGRLAEPPARRKTMMHIALVVALLGLAGSVRGVPTAFDLLGGGTVERPAAAVVQALMALICLLLLVAGVRSFIAARRNPAA